MARAAGQPSEVHSILDIFLNIGCERSRVEIPDEPASLFGYSFLEQYPSILPSLANRTPLSMIRVQISWNLLSFDWQCSAKRIPRHNLLFGSVSRKGVLQWPPLTVPQSHAAVQGMILALVREVPVQIPDEPASLFGYSFLEQYPSILPSLANRTPLSSKTSTVSAHFEVCFSPILVPRLHFKLGRLLNSVA
ncbi:hypothetical protein G5714_011594 [Onychostoma macrolepis]|uniref:Uncharacterized protein n=1 Tax=Onychostoma macrolepis TaxID=369639 RepID=A0A7J6CJ02_9TELE|nr:hypothetical protein G5714_011594 [Onychostoma macrolepis]